MIDKIVHLIDKHLEDSAHPDWNGLLTDLHKLGYNEAEIQEICYAIRQGEY